VEGARITISEGVIVEITRDQSSGCLRSPSAGNGHCAAPAKNGEVTGQQGKLLDAGGYWVLPGCVDLHSDAIEREIEPRPRAIFPVDLAFRELEKRLAGCGITTIFHSLSFAKDQLGLRSNEQAARVIRRLIELAAGPTLIRQRIHLPYEITDLSAVPIILQLLSEGGIDLLSFMDHTPGQGQFRQLEKYKEWVQWSHGIQEKDLEKHLALKNVDREAVFTGVRRLAEKARRMGVPMAIHDADSQERIKMFQEMGVAISEFPVNSETAHYARQLDMDVCVGAPNAVRGNSQAQNLSATKAIESRAANILCSDYYPAAMLCAVFQLAGKLGSLPHAVALVSANPACAAGIAQEAGALEPGRGADLVLVRVADGFPVVLATMVDGKTVYSLQYRDKQDSPP
jgi:alpha-D-ribose 1-methylphosphonate 5-triphosphate diphosphatase